MSDTNKTITDIIKNLRTEADYIEESARSSLKAGETLAGTPFTESDLESALDLAETKRKEADRLEASWKRDTLQFRREIEHLKDERNKAPIRERERLKANGFEIVPKERLERGNAAKLREAVDYLCERVADMDATFDPSEVECLRDAPPRRRATAICRWLWMAQQTTTPTKRGMFSSDTTPTHTSMFRGFCGA